jgi:Flp pilus assembly protein TadB
MSSPLATTTSRDGSGLDNATNRSPSTAAPGSNTMGAVNGSLKNSSGLAISSILTGESPLLRRRKWSEDTHSIVSGGISPHLRIASSEAARDFTAARVSAASRRASSASALARRERFDRHQEMSAPRPAKAAQTAETISGIVPKPMPTAYRAERWARRALQALILLIALACWWVGQCFWYACPPLSAALLLFAYCSPGLVLIIPKDLKENSK